MREVFERPPNFDAINAKFRIAGRPVIFCWGEIIYNPQRVRLTLALRAHEAVHSRRQGDDIPGWWRRYIDDREFRLAEEIPAHCAEYLKLIEQRGNRQGRRAALKQVANRLSSPLYGGVITAVKARRLLAEAT